MDMAKGRPIRTPEERAAAFFEKVNKVPGGCWLWIGALDRHGYGTFNAGNRKQVRAHRWSYQYVRGEVDSRLDLDHLCRVPRCVNPDHLEPVTRSVNLRRGNGPALTRQRMLGGPGRLPKKVRPPKPQVEPPTTLERFDAKVRQGPNGCLLWTGGKTTGYGSFWDGERTVLAHRWAYERAKGDVSPGMVLDHLCRNKACVNPDHIEEVTTGENTRRGPGSITHCHRGHLLPERDGPGGRRCKVCARIAWEAWSATPEGAAKIKANSRRRVERNRLKPRSTPDRSARARTHCPAGHEYPTASVPGKRRKCLPCEAERMRQKRARLKAEAA